MDNQQFLTVSQLNLLIQQVLQMGFPQAVWVCGEIQGYDRSRLKKHVFFNLCEKDLETQEISAQIGLVIFANRKAYLEKVLADSGGPFELKDDIEVKFLCKVDFYPPHGAVRLVVESLDPSYTLGKIAQEKQRLIALLKKTGALDKNKALPVPELPLNIGLITAYDSAAYNDFLSELKLSGLGFSICYRNTQMQGKGAEEDVCRAMDELQRLKGLDVIVITRGGGSVADLSCFDSQKIVGRIAACRLPVLSGIGHEINITITDLAAHTYQKTPTAIASFLVERVEDAMTSLEQQFLNVIDRVLRRLDEHKDQVRSLALNLQSGTQNFLKDHDRKLARFSELLARLPFDQLERGGENLGELQEALQAAVRETFKKGHERLDHARRLISMADPLAICKKGFSITRLVDGTLVRSVSDVRTGDRIEHQVSDGTFESTVG